MAGKDLRLGHFVYYPQISDIKNIIFETMQNPDIIGFLSNYPQPVAELAQKYRQLITDQFPDITEQFDVPAKMIHYCFGQKYADVLCTLIPSKLGVKLGFNRGSELPDPYGILEGSGKIHRYVILGPAMNEYFISELLNHALNAYQMRINK